MLVLSRKIDQEIIIPELGITLKILDAGHNRVKIGISAPADISIHRAEAVATHPKSQLSTASLVPASTQMNAQNAV